MIDLTITIVAYKDYDDVIEAVKSYKKYESPSIKSFIYIVDNSASDEKSDLSRSALINLIESYDNAEYIDSKSNLGFGRGQNLVIDRLDSKYHAIVNPDIIFINNPFEKIIDYLENNRNVGMCIPKLLNLNGDLQMAYRKELTLKDLFIRTFCPKVFKKQFKKQTMQDMDFSKPFQVPFGQGSFWVIRTELFKELKGFDEKFFLYVEDADFCKRLNQVSKLVYYPNASVIHKWERSSHKNMKLFLLHLDSVRKYFYKWGLCPEITENKAILRKLFGGGCKD